MLGLLDRPTSGHIYIDGSDLCCVSSGERTKTRREQIGFVFQSFNLIPTLSALENTMLPLRYSRHPDKKGAAAGVLKQVGLQDRLGFRPGELDSRNGDAIISLLMEFNRSEEQTIIIVTHDLHVASRTRQTMTMVDGKIAADEPRNA